MTPFAKSRSRRSYKDLTAPRYASSSVIEEKFEQKETLRVVCYNIKYGKNIPEAIYFFKNHETLKKADLICLQEMNAPAVEELANALHYNYIYYPSAFHLLPRKDLGNAILSKWPILNDQKIILPFLDPTKLQRIAIEAHIKIHGKLYSVCCVHLNIYSHIEHRKNQIETIVNRLSHEHNPTIIAGDFNSFFKKNCADLKEIFKEKGFEHASHKVDWTYKYKYLLNKTAVLDHIFTKDCRVSDSGMIANKTISDHCPIWVDIKLP